MHAKTYLIEDGYGIRGLEPPGLAAYPAEIRRQFWGWVGEAGLRQKDRDLARGLDKDGKPLRPISAETRKHRRSAMTPSGRGDPSAPPLEPGWQKSRVRSLLTAKAFEDHCEFWWKYDPHSGDSFARILEGQRAMGRDVFGLSPAGLKRVQAEAWTKWAKFKVGGPVPLTREPRLQAVKVPQVGSMNLEHAVGGAGFTDFVKVGQHSGFQTIEAWQAYFRESAPARLPGRAVNPPAVSPISGPKYNRLLGHIWGRTGPDSGPGRAAKPRPAKPAGPARQRAAMAKSPIEKATDEQIKRNRADAAATPVVTLPPKDTAHAANLRHLIQEQEDRIKRIEQERDSNQPEYDKLKADRDLWWDKAHSYKFHLTKATRQKYERLLRDTQARWDELKTKVEDAKYTLRTEHQIKDHYTKELAKETSVPVVVNYAANQKNHPQLIPPGPIQDRLARYTVGDAKIAELSRQPDIAHQKEEADLATKRSDLTRSMDDILRQQAAVIQPASDAGRPITLAENAEVDRLQQQIDLLVTEKDKVKAAQKALSDREAKRLLSIIAAKKPIVFTASDSDAGASNSEGPLKPAWGSIKKTIQQSAEWLSKVVERGDGDFATAMNAKIGTESGRRAHFKTNDPKAPYNIQLSTTDSEWVVVHEFGHAIDDGVKIGDDNILQRSLEFKKYRLKGQKEIPLKTMFPWYDPNEIGADDEFGKFFGASSSQAWYVGKSYGDAATEIVSMGMQALYQDASGFARKDPEYCKFILGILDGSLR
jgi:hypothetical protein